MNIRYRYANDSPKRPHFEGLHNWAKEDVLNPSRGAKVRSGDRMPKRTAMHSVTTMALWENNGMVVMAQGHSFDGVGCTPKEAGWWKLSVQAMKEQDMPLRDMKTEYAAKRRAKKGGCYAGAS